MFNQILTSCFIVNNNKYHLLFYYSFSSFIQDFTVFLINYCTTYNSWNTPPFPSPLVIGFFFLEGQDHLFLVYEQWLVLAFY